MDSLDHGYLAHPSWATGTSRRPLAVASDEEQPYIPAAMEFPSDAPEPKPSQASNGCFLHECRAQSDLKLICAETQNRRIKSGLGENQGSLLSLITPSPNTAQAKPDLLLPRVQALENEVQALRSAIAQHSSTCGWHGSCALGTQSLPISAHGINTLPHTIAGLSALLPHGQSDLQGGVTAGLEYGSSIIAPLQLNNAIDASGLSSIIADNSSNDYFNIDVGAGQSLHDLSVSQDVNAASDMINNGCNSGDFMEVVFDFDAASDRNQGGVDSSTITDTASQMINSSSHNTYSEVMSIDDILDFTPKSLPSGTGAAMGDNMLGAPQGDAHGLAMVVAPNNTASTSSATQGAGTSGPRPYRCTVSMQCHKTFSRRADRDRHELTHNSTSPRTFSCPAAGCDRVGSNGFWRPDKFKEHRAKMGH
ncbi:hypothetical protein DL98DRAFT_572809 [Cadophora sp. DSE1049]|nr:hypothetical protein DL98DRAFT_572809 [Cadophora sp. DSE1049]